MSIKSFSDIDMSYITLPSVSDIIININKCVFISMDIRNITLRFVAPTCSYISDDIGKATPIFYLAKSKPTRD